MIKDCIDKSRIYGKMLDDLTSQEYIYLSNKIRQYYWTKHNLSVPVDSIDIKCIMADKKLLLEVLNDNVG